MTIEAIENNPSCHILDNASEGDRIRIVSSITPDGALTVVKRHSWNDGTEQLFIDGPRKAQFVATRAVNNWRITRFGNRRNPTVWMHSASKV